LAHYRSGQCSERPAQVAAQQAFAAAKRECCGWRSLRERFLSERLQQNRETLGGQAHIFAEGRSLKIDTDRLSEADLIDLNDRITSGIA
jgi:hypothetical protein